MSARALSQQAHACAYAHTNAFKYQLPFIKRVTKFSSVPEEAVNFMNVMEHSINLKIESGKKTLTQKKN